MKIAIVLLALVGMCMAACNSRRVKDEFESFKRLYRKAYASEEEEAMRCAIFAQNLALVESHNALRSRDASITWDYEINKFSDYTPEEFIQKYGGLNPDLQFEEEDRGVAKDVFVADPNYKASASKDWRSLGKVTPVKDQAQCGACWAFSAVAVVESHYAIKYNQLLDLSEQQLVECSSGSPYGNAACKGGLQRKAFDYWKASAGVNLDSAYPYISGNGSNGTTCHNNAVAQSIKITGYKELPKTDDALLQALDTIGPISVAVKAGVTQWTSYRSGSLCDSTFFNPLFTSHDHAVLAVGYTTTDWIVKNSWGTGWGQQGYIYLCRKIKNNSGISGVAGFGGLLGIPPVYASVA